MRHIAAQLFSVPLCFRGSRRAGSVSDRSFAGTPSLTLPARRGFLQKKSGLLFRFWRRNIRLQIFQPALTGFGPLGEGIAVGANALAVPAFFVDVEGDRHLGIA